MTDAKTPKYAPADARGLKPWLVEIREWGDKRERIIYAATKAHAVYMAKGRMRYVTATGRRATPADVERLS